jgi:hypothetical protein
LWWFMKHVFIMKFFMVTARNGLPHCKQPSQFGDHLRFLMSWQGSRSRNREVQMSHTGSSSSMARSSGAQPGRAGPRPMAPTPQHIIKPAMAQGARKQSPIPAAKKQPIRAAKKAADKFRMLCKQQAAKRQPIPAAAPPVQCDMARNKH